MKLVPLGVRGSTPAPGTDFVRYGGHTSCLAVLADGEEHPRLVLDGGTGITSLPGLMDGAPFAGDIVLSHLHWDHVQGIPFCKSIDNPSATVALHLPVGTGDGDSYAVLSRAFSPPHFPIEPRGLMGEWTFRGVATAGDPVAVHTTSGIDVSAAPAYHKGGDALAIRVELQGVSAVYVPDQSFDPSAVNPLHRCALALAAGADVLLHDAQFVPGEEVIAQAYGHSTIDQAAAFADLAGVHALVLTHHGPRRTDDELDDLAERHTKTPGGIPISFARQDAPITVSAS